MTLNITSIRRGRRRKEPDRVVSHFEVWSGRRPDYPVRVALLDAADGSGLYLTLTVCSNHGMTARLTMDNAREMAARIGEMGAER